MADRRSGGNELARPGERRPPRPSLLLLPLLLCGFLDAVRCDAPSILSVNFNDPDDDDRTFSNGDAITLFFATSSTGSFLSSRQIENAVLPNGQGVALPNKAAVDALISFSSPIGAAYNGLWAQLGPMYQLTITITNVTGADTTPLEARLFNVSCVANAINLVAATSEDGPCTSEMPATPTDHWGLGRPHITSVVSSSPNASLLLGAGDLVSIAFDAAVDLNAVALYMSNQAISGYGKAYVRAHTTPIASSPRAPDALRP